MSATTVGRLDWRTILTATDDTPKDVIAALDAYFEAFAAPDMGTGEDGKPTILAVPCPGCGENLTPGLVGSLMGKPQFVWGIAHGEGRCSGCGWPARAHHFVKPVDGGEDLLTLYNVVLAYHPDFVERRA